MVSHPSRRTLLRATGIAVTTGMAGCQLKHRSDDAGSGGGGSGDGGGSNGGAQTATSVPPDASFDIVVRNDITAGDLKPVTDLAQDAKATITVDVERNYMDKDDEIIFEQTVELGPDSKRTFEDAFSTSKGGPQHVVGAKLEPFREEDQDATSKMSITSASRFEPGGFQAPTSTTWYVSVQDGEPRDPFEPWIQVENGSADRLR